MSTVDYKNCPICNSEKLENFLTGKDYSHSGEVFKVVQCANCQFTFTQNPPDSSHIGPYYQSEDYVSHSDTQKGLFFKIYHAVRQHMLVKKRKMVNAHTSKGNLLDIGCGTGYFLNEMKSSNWAVQGIEQDEQAREYGAKKFKLSVHAPEYLDQLESQSLDAVTMWHVLEHVHDLKGYLSKIHHALKENGSLVVAVPNHESYDGKHYGKYWAAWDLPIHLWHFTPSTLEQLMTENQFKVIQHYPLPFDSFYVSILSEKYKKGSAVKGLIVGALSYVQSLVRVKKCSSVVYILKKQ